MSDVLNPESPVYIHTEGSLGFILLNRPDKRNAMNMRMWQAVEEAVRQLDHMPQVRVIIVKSVTEQAFSAGADIAELQAIAADPALREENRQAIRGAQRTLARAKKPTIAQISGACVGGGCGLAIHCDFRFAGENARFGITPARLGIIYPLNDTKQLIDLVGVSAAKRILFTGRLFSASEAEAMGLIDQRTPANALESAVLAFAIELAAVSQYSLDGIKRSIQRVQDGQVDDDETTIQMFLDAHEGVDAAEGIKAFLEKRPAAFTWHHAVDGETGT